MTSTGVVGSITYPPLVGLVAGMAGLGAGMLGAALLIISSGGTVGVAGRLARGPRDLEPTTGRRRR